MMNGESDIPITDWTLEGRKMYVESNKDLIEYIVSISLEELCCERVFTVFGSMDKAVDKIIARFLVNEFDEGKAPCKNIGIFKELDFWISHMTGGKVSSRKRYNEIDTNFLGDVDLGSDHEINQLNRLSSVLREFSMCVASDVISYWFKANKKVVDGLSLKNDNHDTEVKNLRSGSNTTKYKADASFRFLYRLLKVSDSFCSDGYRVFFENKYLVRGLNEPQYTAQGIEDHLTKDKVRRYILRVIDHHDSHKNEYSLFDQNLLKSIAKKSLLELYELDKDEEIRAEYSIKLKSLSDICAEAL